MKALISREPGGPDTLQLADLPDPAVGDTDLLIATKACGLNFPDLLMIQDLYQVKAARPFVPGAEVAGVVVEAGRATRGFEPGDRVMARCGIGGLAESIALDAARCSKIPDAMSMEDAAAFQFVYETSYHALMDRARLRAGETVLVLGASGGVGVAATQIAAAKGARVVAVVSSEDKLAFAKTHGATAGLIYDAEALARDKRAFGQAVKQLAGPRGADVVVDPVGGPLAEIALRAVADGGRHLVLGFTAGIPAIPLNLPLLKSAEIHGINWRTFSMGQPEANAANRAALFAMYERGEIAPPITATYPLSRAAEAIGLFARRTLLGKVVVVI